MIRRQLEEAIWLACEETRERLREERERYPERFAPFFRGLEQGLFTRGFSAAAARRAARGQVPALDRPLGAYIDDYRIAAFQRIVELGDDRIPTGRAAAAVGLSS